MSQENVEAVTAIYDEWKRGNFRAGVDLYDPLILLVQGRNFPEAGAYLGIEGTERYMREFLEAWDRVTIEAEEVLEAGDSVVAAVRQRGAGGESGAVTEFRYFHVWSFRGGRVIRLENFRDRADALEAAGLPKH